MQFMPVQVDKYGKSVWENPTLESIRREECLCHHCDNFRPGGSEENCQIASKLYQICKDHGVATPVSRCESWKQKSGTEYTKAPPTGALASLGFAYLNKAFPLMQINAEGEITCI